MKKILTISLVLICTALYSQTNPYIRDSIMNFYMQSGYANKHFKPKGKTDDMGIRKGDWKDYVATNDFAYLMVDGKPSQVFGDYLVYGEGEYLDNHREGIWKFYLIEDRTFKKILHSEVRFINGEKDGPFSYYFPDGSIGIKGNYSNDEMEGEVKSYYASGELYGTRLYKNGLREGKHTYVYKDGKTEFEQNFTSDTLNGIYRSYYANGKVKESFVSKMGLVDGAYLYYFESGQLWVGKEYRNGLLMNISGNFDTQGNLKDAGTLTNGNGTVKYYTVEGKVYLIETYKEGKKVNEENK